MDAQQRREEIKNQRDHKGKFVAGHDSLFPKPVNIEYTEKIQKMLKQKKEGK